MSKFRKQAEEPRVEREPQEVRGFLEKRAEPKAYELQKRQSYMIDTELLARMERLSVVYGRGFKVWLVNQALEEKITRLEEELTSMHGDWTQSPPKKMIPKEPGRGM